METDSLKHRLDFLLRMLNETTDILKSLAHPTRLELLIYLYYEKYNLQDLTDKLNIPKTTLSHHLQTLQNNSFVDCIDRGVYAITSEGKEYIEALSSLILSLKLRENERLAVQTHRYEELLSRFKGDTKLTDKLDVEIVELPSSKVIAVQSMGPEPEMKAWEKMKNWLVENKFDIQKQTIYGFNNPNPTKDNPNYGYEYWVTTDLDIQPDDIVNIKQMRGGLFAITRCEINGDFMNITRTWKQLVDWVKDSEAYGFDRDDCYEHHPNPDADPADFVLNLYLPIMKTD